MVFRNIPKPQNPKTPKPLNFEIIILILIPSSTFLCFLKIIFIIILLVWPVACGEVITIFGLNCVSGLRNKIKFNLSLS